MNEIHAAREKAENYYSTGEAVAVAATNNKQGSALTSA